MRGATAAAAAAARALRAGRAALGLAAAVAVGGSAYQEEPAAGPPPPQVLREVRVVGGHGGILGDGDSVYKPLQKGARGAAEAAFYRMAFEERGAQVPPASFMPGYRGVCVLGGDEVGGAAAAPTSSNTGGAYLVLEDVTRPFLRPCVMDIKVGVQAWDEDAPPAKVAQERDKYPTQQVVGFRFTGMRVWRWNQQQQHQQQPTGGDAADIDGAGHYAEHGRAFGYALDERSLHHAFYEYLHDGTRVRVEAIPPLLERLAAVRDWFAAQGEFRFYGSSLLFVYEGAPTAAAERSVAAAAAQHYHHHPPPRVDLRMIDFAHVWPIKRGDPAPRDAGYLRGLDNIMAYLRFVQQEHGGGIGGDAGGRSAHPFPRPAAGAPSPPPAASAAA